MNALAVICGAVIGALMLSISITSPNVRWTLATATSQKMWAGDYTAAGVYNWNKKWAAAESTPFRFKGKEYVMESVEGYPKGA